MFHYSQYRSEDAPAIRALIGQFPLALITSRAEGAWQASHVPLFLSDDGQALFGHVDARNPQFALASFEVQVVFMGPNTYVPPEAYASRQLPTWNYLAVHAQGRLTTSADPQHNLALIRMTAERLAGFGSDFRVGDDDARIPRWIGGVLGIHIAIESIEGRFKLSQDKSAADVAAAASHMVRQAGAGVTHELLERLREATGQPLPAAAEAS
jgi:transcriptional regulator